MTERKKKTLKKAVVSEQKCMTSQHSPLPLRPNKWRANEAEWVGNKGGWGWGAPCHSKPLSTPSGTLEGGVGVERGLQQRKGGRRLKKPPGPLEKSGRDSKNTLRAEGPSGPGVNIRWVAAPEHSDSQRRPWWISGVISFSTVLIRGQAVSLGSWLCCTDSCGLTEKNVHQCCCQVQPDQRRRKKATSGIHNSVYWAGCSKINETQ